MQEKYNGEGKIMNTKEGYSRITWVGDPGVLRSKESRKTKEEGIQEF